MSEISIALAQLRCELQNKEQNLLRILQSLEEASKNRADYVLFPELYLTGYTMSEQLCILAEPENGESIRKIREQARRYHVGTIVGFPEAARILALKGVDILAVLAANMVPYQHYQDIYLHARALENHIYVAAANMVGLDNENIFFGESQIVHPDGRSIYKARNNEVVPVLTFDASKKVHNVVEKSTYPPKNKAIIFR